MRNAVCHASQHSTKTTHPSIAYDDHTRPVYLGLSNEGLRRCPVYRVVRDVQAAGPEGAGSLLSNTFSSVRIAKNYSITSCSDDLDPITLERGDYVETGVKGNSQVPRSFRCLRGGGATVYTDNDYSTQSFTS
jgi:hypothetical protein